MSLNPYRKTALAVVLVSTIGLLNSVQEAEAANRKKANKNEAVSSSDMAALVNQLVKQELAESEKDLAPLINDDNFLRRVKFDLTGRLPSPKEVTLFGIDTNPEKRAMMINELLSSDEYGENWAHFWWDVIFSKATEARSDIMQHSFEIWMAKQLNENKPWDQIATEMINAKGDVLENGATALIYTQAGRAEEVASEVSRVFLGIQIQCANCHDHLTDKWKREQFHELASFFARVQVKAIRDKQPRSFGVFSREPRGQENKRALIFKEMKENSENFVKKFDKNKDQKLTRDEIKNPKFQKGFNQILRLADLDSDKALTAEELKTFNIPNKFRSAGGEHFMPNLDDPSDKGEKMDPVFFLTGQEIEVGLDDETRREKLSDFITDKNNEWFAKALINRMWYEMVGEGFYTPVDDIGPERTAIFPEVLDALSEGFISNGYDVKWLMRTIALTDIYQQSLGTSEDDDFSFASANTGRYRSDQLYDAITQVLGVEQESTARNKGRRGGRTSKNTPRFKFKTLFGYDPSLSQDEIQGSVPQALFMMNSTTINNLLKADGNTRLANKLKQFPEDDELVPELYIMVLGRGPTDEELKTCLDYMKESSSREEGAEDILWILLNSSEFLTKR